MNLDKSIGTINIYKIQYNTINNIYMKELYDNLYKN